MSQKRRNKTQRRNKSRPRRGAPHHHGGMCDSCLEQELSPMLEAMLDVLGPDEEGMEDAVDDGRTIVKAVLAGAGDGHHHLTVSSVFGSVILTGNVEGDTAYLNNHDYEMVIAWTHLAAAEVTETPAGIALRSVTDAGMQVRGWSLTPEGEIEPLDDAEIFSAYCTDHETGEPLSPELGVEYCAAFPLGV